MELRQLRCFSAVAEMGSFSRAAVELGLSQPALSKQIRALEEDLGVALLIRDGRGARLTAAGDELFRRFAAIEEQLAAARAAARRVGGAGRAISIGVTSSLGPLFQADLIRRIERATGQTEIRLVEGYSRQLQGWLHSGRIDVALMYGSKEDNTGEILAVVEEDLFLVTAPGHPLAVRSEVAFNDLGLAELLSLDQPSRVREMLEVEAMRRGIGLRFGHLIDSIGAIKVIVAGGAAAAVLPFAAVEREVREGRLVATAITDPVLQLDLAIVVSKRAGVARETVAVAREIEAMITERLASNQWLGSRSKPVGPVARPAS